MAGKLTKDEEKFIEEQRERLEKVIEINKEILEKFRSDEMFSLSYGSWSRLLRTLKRPWK